MGRVSPRIEAVEGRGWLRRWDNQSGQAWDTGCFPGHRGPGDIILSGLGTGSLPLSLPSPTTHTPWTQLLPATCSRPSCPHVLLSSCPPVLVSSRLPVQLSRSQLHNPTRPFSLTLPLMSKCHRSSRCLGPSGCKEELTKGPVESLQREHTTAEWCTSKPSRRGGVCLLSQLEINF